MKDIWNSLKDYIYAAVMVAVFGMLIMVTSQEWIEIDEIIVIYLLSLILIKIKQLGPKW